MKSEYAGIDYSMGKSNVNHETGIHYGVINQSEVLQAWCDSNEPYYAPYCPYCGEEIAKDYDAMVNKKKCPKCKHKFDDSSFDMIEPSGFEYNRDGYKCEQSADDTDIFILESPYYTYAQFCSPCAQGAGYLMNWYKLPSFNQGDFLDPHTTPYAIGAYKNGAENAGYPKVYCFDASWFEDEKAPYPVFSVETGELIEA